MAVLEQTWQHEYIISNDVKLHYVTQGEGPLMLMLHGFLSSGTPGVTKSRNSPRIIRLLPLICGATTKAISRHSNQLM
jgi:hypothetical protein